MKYGYLLFGDSQCLTVTDGEYGDSWPFLLQSFMKRPVHNYSRGGRQMIHGHVIGALRDLNLTPDETYADTVIVALGSVDAIYNIDVGDTPAQIQDFAGNRGFQTVFILPPDNLIMANDTMRQVIADQVTHAIDIDPYINAKLHYGDDVHMNKIGHNVYAPAIFWALATLGLVHP